MTTSERTTPSTIHKGLADVVIAETRLSDVDGANCRLIYRGYDIGELVGKASYEEACFLLLHGHLPATGELTRFNEHVVTRRALDPELLRTMSAIPLNNPMSYLRTVVSLMGLADQQAERIDPASGLNHALDLIAKTPTIIAMFERLRKKQPMLGPRPDLSHAGNFLYMLHGENPDPRQTAALDAYFVLLADHGFNASTFAARTTVATQSDFYSGIVSAIGTLKGPLHGAANTKAMEMLLHIGSPDQVEPYVQQTLADHKRFMGFGHRVYKGEDPRAKHLEHYAHDLGVMNGELTWFEISKRLQAAVWKAKGLYINVDFYSASLLYYLRIPVDLFTPMFACARMVGWSAQLLEQYADNRLIRPLAAYVGPRDLKFVPIDQRHEAARVSG